MHAPIEADLFDLGGTVEKWNNRFMKGTPSTFDEVRVLGRDVIYLVAALGRVPVTEVYQEETAWEDHIGYIGLDFSRNQEGEFYALVPSPTGFVSAFETMSPEELADFVYKGFLLSHRTAIALATFREPISSLIGQVAWPDNTHLLN